MGKVFRVSENERRLYTFEVPEKYHREYNGDYVSYHATSKKEKEGNKASSWAKKDKDGKILYPAFPGQACYSLLRPDYFNYHITCVPWQRRQDPVIKLGEAQDFFRIMAGFGIIPEKGIELREEEHPEWGTGIVCHIEAGHRNNQQIYTALTCYRWIDAHPPLVWHFLKIYQSDLGLTPFQILPYLVATYVANVNHSFVYSYTTSEASTYEGGPCASCRNPLLGVALKVFFDETDKRGINYCAPDQFIYRAVQSICRELTEVIVTTGSYAGKTLPVYEVGEPEDSLHPKFKPLYEIPNISREQATEILKQLFTKGK